MKLRFLSRDSVWLPLAGGLLVLVAMTLLLSAIANEVVNDAPLTVTDVRFGDWIHSHATPHVTRFMFVVTHLHGTVPVSIAVSVVTLYLIARRRFYWVATVLLSVFGGMLLNLGLKAIFQRGRPQFQDPIISLTSYSFPSGHTMAATVLYGVMAALLVAGTQSWWKRTAIISLAFIMIALVGFTRIYLGAHYLTDVVAAMAEGLAWLSVSLTGVYYVWRHRN